jgi:hypothetical protein
MARWWGPGMARTGGEGGETTDAAGCPLAAVEEAVVDGEER